MQQRASLEFSTFPQAFWNWTTYEIIQNNRVPYLNSLPGDLAGFPVFNLGVCNNIALYCTGKHHSYYMPSYEYMRAVLHKPSIFRNACYSCCD